MLLTVTACSTVATGHGSPGVTPKPSPTPSSSTTIQFSDCSQLLGVSTAGLTPDLLKHLTFDCGKVPVPLNYTDPTGPTIEIEVLRVHDDQQQKKIGSLLVNPGGPGAAGLTLPISLLPVMSEKVLENFDLIGFDPRGVELSSPIECISDQQKDTLDAEDFDVLTPSGFAAAKAAADSVAQACSAAYGPALADYNTVFTAMDMDRIRQALGDPVLNYLGFSYGTSLGTVYAHLYPTKIRVAALDGAVDPTTSVLTSDADQIQGFESAFDQFAADCMKRPACAVLGNPRQAVYALTAKANAIPIKSSLPGETRTATGVIVLTAVSEALYVQADWVPLGEALVSAQKGDSAGLFALADQYNQRSPDGKYSNVEDANTTINCNDEPAGPSDALIRATAASWAKKYPMFGAWQASSLFTCQDWQPVRHPLPPPSAAGSAPILVVGTVHDPATPYAGAGDLATALTTGHLLTWNGQGHTAYMFSTCIQKYVDNYLVTTKLPPAGTVCPA